MSALTIPALAASLLEVTPAGDGAASIFIDASRPAPFTITRRMYGKFTEHLGANVYQGAWAQLLLNPGCESGAVWGNPWGNAEEALRHAIQRLERESGIKGFDPAVSRKKGLGFCWAALDGPGRFGLDAGVNGFAQRLSAPAGKRTGMVTPVFPPVHRCRKIEISLHAKVQPGTKLSVALTPPRPGATPYCRAEIRAGAAWRKHRATLTLPAGKVKRGSPVFLAILLEKGGMAWLDQVLAFPTDNLDGWDPDVVRYLKEAKVSLIRFPGGNFVSGYRWEDGIGPPEKRPAKPNPAWAGVEWNHVGTDEWLRLCELVGAEPMICVNAGDGTPEEAARWVKYCGRKVKLWEAGNEIYGSWQVGHTDAEGYAARYSLFARAMRKAGKHIRLVACGDTPDWHRELIRRNRKAVESISAHYLPAHNVPRDTEPEEICRELVADASLFFHRYLWPRAEPFLKIGVEPKLALTELQILNRWNATTMEALYYSAIMNECIRGGQVVEMVTHSALINHGGGLVKRRGIVAPQPVHWALWLYSTQPGVRPVPVAVSGPVFSTSGKWLGKVEGSSWLDPLALLSKDRRELTVLVTNRHPQRSIRTFIGVEGFSPRSPARVAALAPNNLMQGANLDQVDELKPESRDVKVAGNTVSLNLPPHSITRVILRRR